MPSPYYPFMSLTGRAKEAKKQKKKKKTPDLRLGEGFFIGTASLEVPDIERGDLEQALKKAPLLLPIFECF